MLAAQLALQRQQDLEQRRAAVRARKQEVAATREAKTQRQEEVQAQAKAVREAGRRGKTKRAQVLTPFSFATGVHTTGGGSRAAAAPPAPPPAAGPGAAVPELRERGGRRGAGDGGEQSAMNAQALALKPYKELQAMAKVRGICANGKKDAMVAALAEHGASGGGGKPALGGGGGRAGHKRKRDDEVVAGGGGIASCRSCCERHRLDSSSKFFAAERVFGRRLAGYCYSCRCCYEKKDLKSGIVHYGLCRYHYDDEFDFQESPDHVVLLSR
jgi:hypothetical protein